MDFEESQSKKGGKITALPSLDDDGEKEEEQGEGKNEEGERKEGKKRKEEEEGTEGKVEVKDHVERSGGEGSTSTTDEYLTGVEQSSSSLDTPTTTANPGSVVVVHNNGEVILPETGKKKRLLLLNISTESSSSLDTLTGTEDSKRESDVLRYISSNPVLEGSFPEEESSEQDKHHKYETVCGSSASLDTLTGGTDEGGKAIKQKKKRRFSLLKSSSPSVAKSSADEEDRKSSSQDTLTSGVVLPEEEKKKGKFGALKSSFRRDKGSIFKLKKKKSDLEQSETSIELDPGENSEKDSTGTKSSGQSSRETQLGSDNLAALDTTGKPKKAKKRSKAQALVRKLSLSKFRSQSTEQQEPRHTPEGGDSSHSQSQSSQESPGHSLDSPSRIVGGKGSGPVQDLEKEKEKGIEHREKGELTRKPENLIERPVSTITVVRRKSPSLTIRSTFDRSPTNSQNECEEPQDQDSEKCQKEIQCTSTLPYAISKWPDAETTDSNPRRKLYVKADSESAVATPKSSPGELRRKLSLLEEKRAIFQKRLFETSEDTDSGETVIAQDGSTKVSSDSSGSGTTKKTARHISVRKFDTFSTFDGTFDEDTGLGYLTGIEEDYSESYTERQNEEYLDLRTAVIMGPMTGAIASTSNGPDSIERTKSAVQDNSSSQNNIQNAAVVGEKREHLYKILVIGELGAGKTSIIKRYVHQFFSQHYRATIGVDFALKVLNWDPHTIIRLQLWDIAGQERFGNMTRVYYKEAVGAFIVFDVTRSATLDAVVKWKQDLDSKVQLPDGSPIPCVLLANKCDQQKEGMVTSPAKMDEYCKEKNFAGWFETSAKENINIEEAARFLVNKILQNDQTMKGNVAQDQIDGERFALNQSPTNSKKSCAC